MESAGEKYYYGSEYTYVSPMSQLRDRRRRWVDYNMFWSAITSWDPWLLMGDSPGFVMWRGYGQKLARPDDAPAPLLAHIAKAQPNYLDQGAPWEGTESSFVSFMTTRKPAPKS